MEPVVTQCRLSSFFLTRCQLSIVKCIRVQIWKGMILITHIQRQGGKTNVMQTSAPANIMLKTRPNSWKFSKLWVTRCPEKPKSLGLDTHDELNRPIRVWIPFLLHSACLRRFLFPRNDDDLKLVSAIESNNDCSENDKWKHLINIKRTARNSVHNDVKIIS